MYSTRLTGTNSATYLTLGVPLSSVWHRVLAKEFTQSVRDASDLVFVQLGVIVLFGSRCKRVKECLES